MDILLPSATRKQVVEARELLNLEFVLRRSPCTHLLFLIQRVSVLILAAYETNYLFAARTFYDSSWFSRRGRGRR